jgi:predicted ATPase/DNA-binding CsgD family transcriptional regulator/Tfp pilus assembly protein PilF
VPVPNNLPAELSSFIGRERQLAELRRLLRGTRLITLVGAGGAGKTRLALKLASDVRDRNPDGVWLVELAALSDPQLLEQTVASSCGVMEDSLRPVDDVLTGALSSRRALVILDGCEHLVDRCADLATRLLRSCPELTLLTTSREPLGVPGELIWRTPSLSLPRSEDADQPELILESEAVRLFVERARLGRPDFELDRNASNAVAQICTRLEGIPLAIELAAGLARVMTIEEILGRLDDRFRLLTGGSRTALPRHQTLRQTVDWSYGLLSPVEKELFAQLAVFAGGFDLSAAEAVAQHAPPDRDGVLPVLSRLVDKSLVTAEAGRLHNTRYRMVDTIREYAQERLQQSGHGDVRRRHATYFLKWCRAAAKELTSHGQLDWLRRVDEEQPNIRLALDWSLTEQQGDAVLLAASMNLYWNMRCHLVEGLGWLDRALEVRVASSEARAAALLARARIQARHGAFAEAGRDAEEVVALSSGNEFTGSAFTILGVMAGTRGDWDTAGRYHSGALELAVQVANPVRVASSLNNLALLASARGDHAAARDQLERALAECRAAGDRYVASYILDSLGCVCLRLDDNTGARRYYLEALAASQEFEDSVNIASSLEGMALLALAEGDPGRMVRLTAASKTLRAASGGEATPEWTKQVEDGLGAARTKLGRQAADAAWRAGQALSPEEAIRSAAGAVTAVTHDGGPLTARERQVAALVADGLTNGEIAGRLKMAGRTADAHVEHIRNKLGLRSRSQIAVWAHERLGQDRDVAR